MTDEERREAARVRTREWRQRPGNRERETATKAAYRAANPDLVAAQKKATNQRYNEAHREEVRARANAVREDLRRQVIEAYGGRCACPGCHVTHAELLTVDHVNGGARHRANRRSTRDIYRQIVKAGFPPDFQLLCGSCNLAKSDRPACPIAGQDH